MSLNSTIRLAIIDEINNQRILDTFLRQDVESKIDRHAIKYDKRLLDFEQKLPNHVASILASRSGLDRSISEMMERSLKFYDSDLKERTKTHLKDVDEYIRTHKITEKQRDIIKDELRDEFDEKIFSAISTTVLTGGFCFIICMLHKP